MSALSKKAPQQGGKSINRLGVLIAGCTLQLFLGILYVWSVFVEPVSKEFGWNISSVKLTSSFMISFFVVGILVGGNLQIRLGAQKVVLIGGLTLAAGMLITGFLPAGAAVCIYVTYGVAGGFGVGAAYNAIITAAQKWYPEKRGMATGFSVCAFGLSTVIFAPLIEALIRLFGLRETFFILAAAFGAIVLALFSFIRLPTDSQTASLSKDTTRKTTAAAPQVPKRQFTVSEIVKTREFYLITLSLMLGTAAFFILNPSFKSLAAERGLGTAFGTVIVMLTGVANAFGRLATPLISDKIGRERAAVLVILITAFCALLLSFSTDAIFIASIAVIAFCYGGYSGLYPVLTADYFGLKNVGSNYGAVMLGFAISALAFPALIGLIGSVAIKFYTLAALAVVGALLVLLLIKSSPKKA